MIAQILLHLVCTILLSSHQASSQGPESTELQDLSGRNADFAARLYRAIASRTDDNVCFSPLTISMGLAALMSGTEGSTRLQLLQGLTLTSLEPSQIPELFQKLRETISATNQFNFDRVVGLFPSQQFSVPSDYREVVLNKYGGKIQNLDFSDPLASQNAINEMGEQGTNYVIKDLVSTVNPQSQLMLATAAYFKGQFALAFNASFTQEERFYVGKYRIVTVPMMFRSDKYYLAYDSSLKLGVLKLAMSGGAAMLVLLPDEDVDITSVDEEITAERFQGWVKQLKKTKLEVQLPKFELEQSYSLTNLLPGLEVREVFEASADLSGIGGDIGLKLSEVVHKAAIAVDEISNGLGGGTVNIFASLPPRLTINRPFLFLVYHESTRSILFMGRVVDPTKK
ncbi:serpin peptidase inhibitor, clade A (alpha-1 antiproteinase, antitrypsin), member 10a [Aplochiton taeniatus]